MTATETTRAMIRPLPVFFLRFAPSISARTSSSSGCSDRPASISADDMHAQYRPPEELPAAGRLATVVVLG
jgi:hypothetical protein